MSNSHLDTQWNWTVQDTIRQFVPATFFDNFTLIDRFPDYMFNFEGAIHYMWFKEYHPDAWARLQKYVADGRWRLSGSWINAVDTNVPSPEALLRQALYGKRFFRQEFDRVPLDIYLPGLLRLRLRAAVDRRALGPHARSRRRSCRGAPPSRRRSPSASGRAPTASRWWPRCGPATT